MDEYYTWYVGSEWHKCWPEFMYVGQWPIFHGPVILPHILKTSWWAIVIIGILVPCDAKICLIKCKWVSDLHFKVQWFCHILKTIWWMSVVLEVLIQCDTNTDLIYVGQCPIFHGLVILPSVLKTIWWTNIIIAILDVCDAKIYHIKCMWVSDYISWSSNFVLYLEDVLMEECNLLYWRYCVIWATDLYFII